MKIKVICAIEEYTLHDHIQINSVTAKIYITSYMQSNPINTDTKGALESVRCRIKGVFILSRLNLEKM